MIEVTDEDRSVAAQYTSREYAGEVEALARIIARYRQQVEEGVSLMLQARIKRLVTNDTGDAAAGFYNGVDAAVAAIRATQARPAEQRG